MTTATAALLAATWAAVMAAASFYVIDPEGGILKIKFTPDGERADDRNVECWLMAGYDGSVYD